MKKYYLFMMLFYSSFFAFAINKTPDIIPLPSKITMKEGNFLINNKTNIVVEDQLTGIIDVADLFLNQLKTLAATSTEIHQFEKGEKYNQTILLKTMGNLSDSLGEEGYILDINPNNLSILASTPKGIFYGIQTLWQLFPSKATTVQAVKTYAIPALTIVDKPRFKWRGMLLDCCRHFMPKETILKYIDLLAFYKMNRLHWHLTEDQAWRIEIKQYPNLTNIGSKRIEEDGSEYKGFYSQVEVKEIVEYAAKRNISIVPEIEMPGHSIAAIASYPFLSCTQQPIKTETNWGVFKDVYCAGNDSVFQFL
ncbi:MAG: beta-N-acetylhexosaminidase, partial [Bacteroidota bacterium]